jgi:hypothetical protein
MDDLRVWAGFLMSSQKWLPICPLKTGPPLRCTEICSDAAGLAVSENANHGPGCGSVSWNEDGIIIFASQVVWPRKFIESEKNESGIRFGDNSTFLELLGILIPFLLSPDLFKNKRIVLKVDNLGVIFGIWNRNLKSDTCSAILIRALYLISAFLGSEIFAEHLPRKSNWESNLVDRLSRISSTTVNDKALISSFRVRELPDCLKE